MQKEAGRQPWLNNLNLTDIQPERTSVSGGINLKGKRDKSMKLT